MIQPLNWDAISQKKLKNIAFGGLARADGSQLYVWEWVTRVWGRTDLSMCCCFLPSEKPLDLTQAQKESILKPFALVTAKPRQEYRQDTTTYPPLITSMTDEIPCVYF